MKKINGFVNLYLDKTPCAEGRENETWSSDVHPTMDVAEAQRAPDDPGGLVFLKCVPVEWSES